VFVASLHSPSFLKLIKSAPWLAILLVPTELATHYHFAFNELQFYLAFTFYYTDLRTITFVFRMFSAAVCQLIFNLTWLRYIQVFAIANPSVVDLSVVCNVRAPYSGGWNFLFYISSPFCTLAILAKPS